MDRFITIEGCEGVGKSTQVELLKEYLKNTRQDAIFTREPGGTETAEKIRNIILQDNMNRYTEAHLFAAARIEHINNVILPALKQGKMVICDRYIDSSFAYQGFGRGLGIEKVKEINEYVLRKCMPCCTIFIDMNPLNSWRKQKGKIVDDRLESESAQFHTKVYNGFKQIAKDNSRYELIVPEIEKKDTLNKIIEALRKRELIK